MLPDGGYLLSSLRSSFEGLQEAEEICGTFEAREILLTRTAVRSAGLCRCQCVSFVRARMKGLEGVGTSLDDLPTKIKVETEICANVSLLTVNVDSVRLWSGRIGESAPREVEPRP